MEEIQRLEDKVRAPACSIVPVCVLMVIGR
jgi:hypothetical protein